MRIRIDEAPQDLRRRVAQRLGSVRGTPTAPGADTARLGDLACPVCRPDIEGVACWEFEVVGPKAMRPRDRKGKAGGVGFVLAGAGRHDIRLSHWSETIGPPSRALRARAETGPLARVVKPDTLASVAETRSAATSRTSARSPRASPPAASMPRRCAGSAR